MSALGLLVLITAIGVGGVVLAISGWAQATPSLARTVARLQRPAVDRCATDRRNGRAGRMMSPLVGLARREPRLVPSDTELLLIGRSLEQHTVYLVAAIGAGLVGPPLLLALLQAAGVVDLGVYVPTIVAIGCAVLAPIMVHVTAVERATSVRSDLRYQVSAYLDVVTMLLAGNAGYEGALEQAARAGDGRLFAELRRRMRESGARGISLTEALDRAGRELGLDELEQIAATAALSAAEGAPVARTLAAKCSTLRSALATEQEAEARLRTSRLTTPIVGMALIFMALVIYPALSFS